LQELHAEIGLTALGLAITLYYWDGVIGANGSSASSHGADQLFVSNGYSLVEMLVKEARR
jgi:hypothetical protein